MQFLKYKAFNNNLISLLVIIINKNKNIMINTQKLIQNIIINKTKIDKVKLSYK